MKYLTQNFENLTAYSGILFERPQFEKSMKNFPTFYRNRKFIRAIRRVPHFFLS
jgi:hypothetical protein